MFLIMLRFSNNKSAAAEHMQAHNAWIAKGFEDGVFLLTGSVEPKQGGAVLAYNIAGDELEKRVARSGSPAHRCAILFRRPSPWR